MSGSWRLCLALAAGMSGAQAAIADPVWDPAEIARLSTQAAQLAGNLAGTIDVLRSYGRMANEIGGAGARAFSSPASSAMLGYAPSVPPGAPTSGDAQAALAGDALAISQVQQQRQFWLAARQTIDAEGLAASLAVTEDAGSAPVRTRTLAAAANAAQDLRSDVQANSAACLAVLSELGAIQSVLALLLEQRASARIVRTIGNGGRA